MVQNQKVLMVQDHNYGPGRGKNVTKAKHCTTEVGMYGSQ